MADKVDFAFLLPGRNFSQYFLNSWTNTLLWLYENKYTFSYSSLYLSSLDMVRNNILSYPPSSPIFGQPPINDPRPFGGEIEPNRVVFIDSDMVWDIEALEKLLITDEDVLVAPYRVSPYNDKTVIMANNHLYTAEDIKKLDSPIEVDMAGLGFTSCKFEVIQSMSYPWFYTTFSPEGINGEDYNFYQNAKKLGYKVVMDPSIKVGHEKNLIV